MVSYKQEYKFLKPKLENKNFLPIGAVFSFLIAIVVYSGWYYNESSKTSKPLLNEIAEIENQELNYSDNYVIIEEKKDFTNNSLSQNSIEDLKEVSVLPGQTILDVNEREQKVISKSIEFENVKKINNQKELDTILADSKLSEMSAIANERDRSTEMVLKASGNSWVEIEDIDGNSLMTRLMRSGESYVVPNKSGLTFNTGNAGALSLSYGNILIPSLGEIGEIINARPLKVEAFQNIKIVN